MQGGCMYFGKCFSLFAILDESPFFTELSMIEREKLVKELLQTYPQLNKQMTSDIEVGYEASWLVKQAN
jgi:stress-induced morphogen